MPLCALEMFFVNVVFTNFGKKCPVSCGWSRICICVFLLHLLFGILLAKRCQRFGYFTFILVLLVSAQTLR